MPIKSILLTVCLFCSFALFSQNYSGLENKKLLRSDDVSSLLESGIGILFGNKLSGDIDSVVVKQDAERILKLKIYYTGYLNGYFSVSVLNGSRQVQKEFSVYQFSQTSNPSVAECTIQMSTIVPDNTELESPLLRIDISKKKNGTTGKVSVFNLNKKWQSTINNSNVVIDIKPIPIGQAARLTNERKDYVPVKTIKFDPTINYLNPRISERIRPVSGGGSSFNRLYDNFADVFYAVSGTWVNTDINTQGITKLIITNDNKIKVFGKCSPQDCDWGEKPLIKLSAMVYRAVFSWSFKTVTLIITEQTDGTLKLNGKDVYNDGRPVRNYTNTFKRNLGIVVAKTNFITLKQFALLPPAGNPADKSPKGPDKNKSFYLMDGLSADVDFRRPQDISNININVYPDKNSYSGVYYIMPADYHLLWQPKSEAEKGYEFRILYGAQEVAEGSAAPVRMSATLSAGISNREREFVKELIKSLKPDFKTLTFLPLRQNPQFTFQNTLGSQYDIAEEKISTESISDLNSDIRVAWQTDATTKDFIQAAITSREGIAASVILQPEDEDIIDQQIPATINLADIRTLGKMNLMPNLWRTQLWMNETPYPLKLKNIHILKKQISDVKPIIYSWSLNNTIVPSQSKVNFTNITIPTWLDNEPSSVIWIEYSVEECNECDTKVMDAITGGVSGTRAQQIKFSIPPAVFDSLNASQIMITLRSIQGDPKGITVKEFPSLKLTQASNESSIGPLYLPSSSSLQYEFKIIISSKDGDFYNSNSWIPGSALENYLGKTQLKQIFTGIIPGID